MAKSDTSGKGKADPLAAGQPSESDAGTSEAQAEPVLVPDPADAATRSAQTAYQDFADNFSADDLVRVVWHCGRDDSCGSLAHVLNLLVCDGTVTETARVLGLLIAAAAADCDACS